MRCIKDGLTRYDRDKATPGYTIFSPLHNSKQSTLLLDMEGRIVKEWPLATDPGNYGYLLKNGNLFVASTTEPGPPYPPKGGLMQEIDWDGKVVWEYCDDYQHHDFRQLDNGNLIYLGWEVLPENYTSRIKGGIPGSEADAGIWGDYIREVNRAGETVWEWHIYDHVDPEKYPLPDHAHRQEYAHANTLAPTADGNLLVCLRQIDLVILIDKASGEIIWERQDRNWGGPHDPQELENGNILIFANRDGQRPLGSQIIEFDRHSGETVWAYQGNPTHSFFSHFISGAQRLWSGNTLICEGLWGRLFEVTPDGEIVWEYVSPYWSPNLKGPTVGDCNFVFRAYRYQADGPEIRGRLDQEP